MKTFESDAEDDLRCFLETGHQCTYEELMIYEGDRISLGQDAVPGAYRSEVLHLADAW